MGANLSRNRRDSNSIGMGRLGQQNGDNDIENGGIPNETTPVLGPASDQIRPGQQNGKVDVESGINPDTTSNGIPKKASDQIGGLKQNGEESSLQEVMTNGNLDAIPEVNSETEMVQDADPVEEAVKRNTLFPPNMNSKETSEESGTNSKWYDCLIPGRCQIPECIKNIPTTLKQAKWRNGHLEKILVLVECVRSLVVWLTPMALMIAFPAYDVVTDCIAASDHFNDGNQWYAWATIVFVIIPVVLSLTLGKGYKELQEAATLSNFKETKREQIKNKNPLWKYEKVEEEVKLRIPGTYRRILIFIQTFLGFVPGLSWVPLPKKVGESNGKSHDQTLVARKMFEFFGEDTPQTILQLSIELSRMDKDIKSLGGLWLKIFNLSPITIIRSPIVSSLFGSIKKSATVYLELMSKDKHGGEFEPYKTWKNQLIAIPMMLFTVVPRVLTLSLFFASCFPLFSNYSEGYRFGLILFICTFIHYSVIFAIGSYVGRKKKVGKSKLILSGLSALISPCLIVDQTCGTFLWASCLSIIHHHLILLVGLGLTLVHNPSMWNPSLSNSSQELYTQLLYVLLPWLALSLFGSLFLHEFGQIPFRHRIGKTLGLDYLCYEDGKEFVTACKDGNVPLVELMLKFSNSSFLNHTDVRGEKTGLHLACEKNRLEVVKLLVKDQNSNINVKDSIGQTALHWACQNVSRGEKTGLHLACEKNRLEVVKLLVKDPNSNINVKDNIGQTALHWACQNDSLEVVKLLVKDPSININIKNSKGYSALVYCKDKEIATVLLESGKRNIQDDITFVGACKFGSVVIVESLLKSDSSVLNLTENENSLTTEGMKMCERKSGFHFACEKNRLEVVKILVKDPNIKINAKDSLGRTGLHLACEKNSLEVVKLLVEETNVDLNIRDNEGFNALAFSINNEQVARVLLESGKLLVKDPNSNINVKDSIGQTALRWACENDVAKLVKNKDGSIQFRYRQWYHGNHVLIKIDPTTTSVLSFTKD